MPDNPSENDFMEIVTAAVQAERNAGDQRLEDAQSALQAALEDLAKAKQQALDNHVQAGHAAAALNRVLLHVTGCSAGEFDTHMETAERIIEQLKEASESSAQTKNELTAALGDLAKANSALTSEQIAHGKTMKEREKLACALKIAERTISEAMRATSVMNLDRAGCLLSAYQLSGLDYDAILSAHDRDVAARVLREISSEGMRCLFDVSLLEMIAAQYEGGQREVPA